MRAPACDERHAPSAECNGCRRAAWTVHDDDGIALHGGRCDDGTAESYVLAGVLYHVNDEGLSVCRSAENWARWLAIHAAKRDAGGTEGGAE